MKEKQDPMFSSLSEGSVLQTIKVGFSLISFNVLIEKIPSKL